MSFGGSHPPPVKAAEPVPKESDAAVEAARLAEQERLRRMRGRRHTILTGAQGITEEANTRKKTLLGE